MPGSNADSVSKDSFLLVQFKKFPKPSSKSNEEVNNSENLKVSENLEVSENLK